MLITKTNPSGIDWYIQQLQTKVHDILVGASRWNLADTDKYRGYGRCNRNKTDNGYIAENYEGANEYRELYFDDTLTAISFFGISNRIDLSVGAQADVHLVFFVNLEALALKDHTGAAITHRADEEVRRSVLSIIGNNSFGFQVQSVELWLENVLKEYAGSRRDDRLKFIDMHPYHCFRINMTLKFNQNKIC